MRQTLGAHAAGIVFTAVSSALLFAAATPASAEQYALLIGVNDCPKFRPSDGIRPRPLRGAESDAQAIASLLMRSERFSPEHVQLLMGEKATCAAVRKAWKNIQAKVKPADSVLFYFAGHGTQIKDQRPRDEEDDELDEALCLADTMADGASLLLDDELAIWLEDTPALRVTAIIDACHSGTATKDPEDELVPRYLTIVPAGGGVSKPSDLWEDLSNASKSPLKQCTGLFACQSYQQAYERRLPGQKPGERSGQFTHYLLKGVHDLHADRDHNGQLTGQELLDYARGKLDESFNKQRSLADRQEPVLVGESREPILGAAKAPTRE